jgi:predicted transcriptional regulator
VARDRSGSVHVFEAAVKRDEIVGRRLQAVADQLCDGSWTPLLTHLVHNRKLSSAERAALRHLVGELEQRGDDKKRRGRDAQ